MKTFKALIITTFCVLTFLAVRAQNNESSSTLDKLCAPAMWHSKNYQTDEIYSFMKFDKNTIKVGMFGEGRELYNTFTYYLSDTIPAIFDSSKVSNINHGKYIIVSQPGEVDAFEIKEITHEKLTIVLVEYEIESVLDAEY